MELSSKRGININGKLIILLAILLMGLFLRIYDLSNESLWLDEGFSIRFANLSLYQIFFLPETNPPLYYIILHWWINLFGDSEFSVRFPSVIFGFLSIFMVYKSSPYYPLRIFFYKTTQKKELYSFVWLYSI